MMTGLTIKAVWIHMLSRPFGKPALFAAIAIGLLSPLFAISRFHTERAAVELVSRSDSGGPFLVPATCNMIGAEHGKDYVVANGKKLNGRGSRSACFYTMSAFKRLFPERINANESSAFHAQELTTKTKLLYPSTSFASTLLTGSFLVPFVILGFSMLTAAAELMRRKIGHSS